MDKKTDYFELERILITLVQYCSADSLTRQFTVSTNIISRLCLLYLGKSRSHRQHHGSLSRLILFTKHQPPPLLQTEEDTTTEEAVLNWYESLNQPMTNKQAEYKRV